MEVDERLRWFEVHITSSLRPRNDDLKTLFNSDEYRQIFMEFCNNEDIRRLFVYTKEPKTTLTVSISPPLKFHGKAMFFLKTNQASKLTKDNIREDVVYTDCNTIALNQLDLLAREVYLPLLCTDGVQTYGGVSADKLLDILHRMMGMTEVTEGHLEGTITLPLPSIEVLADAASLPNRRAAVIHVLESSVIGWIKQIRIVLKHEPLQELAAQFGTHPGPLDELALWKQRQIKLRSINTQLDSAVASDILLNLDEANSTYSHSFHNVRKEISQAMVETEENLRFLKTLKHWFEQLHLASTPATMLTIFPPLVHTLMLVWSHSRYYHVPSNFHNLLRLVSNEVVARAENLVGNHILKNTLESYAGLKDALRVSAAFRGTYLDMKDRADEVNMERVSETTEAMTMNPPKGMLYNTKLYSTASRRKTRTPTADLLRTTSAMSVIVIQEDEWIDSPWPQRNAPCFNLMNSFMERCNDLLELVQTTGHFNLLQKAAEVGGAGTKSLDALVREIHRQFTESMDSFNRNVENILDLMATQAFEKAFFTFRTIVKDLERQLAFVLRQSFQQCPTIGSQLRLLEVFEGISSRELVQKHLKDKDSQLVMSFTSELISVRNMFIKGNRSPPQHSHFPPVVSRLIWIRALRRRIQEPMEKLKRVSPHSLEGDTGWHLRDQFAEAMKEFTNYEEKTITDWQVNIQAELHDRVKQPLLVADEFSDDVEMRPQLVHVNLDPDLLLLLREVHYLSQEPFNIKLPDNVRTMLRHTDGNSLRTMGARLETIVAKYNSVMRCLVEFEKPLFERKLNKIDHLFDQGLNHYTWNMTESADFIELASSLVSLDLHRTLAIIQTNCQEIVDITQCWSLAGLDVFTSRDNDTSYSMNDLIEWQIKLNEEFERNVKPSGQRIHSLLMDSFQAVQISKASPAWEDYVEHIDALVLDGLKEATLKSLRNMLNTLVHCNMAEEISVPILTIRLELIENAVSFTPPLDHNTAVTCVEEEVDQWLNMYRGRGSLVPMLSPESEGGYHDFIALDEEILQLSEQITLLVRENSEECKKLLELFSNYTFLWMQDISETFEEFLYGRLTPTPTSSPKKTTIMRSAASARSQISARSGRASSASNSIGRAGLMGTAEKSFLSPQHSRDEHVNVPSLDMFDVEIDVYRRSRDEIANIMDYTDVGWLRVDMTPIKQVLTTYTSRWMWTFIKYLSDQVTGMLRDLDDFLKRTEPEIESITGEERDTASFMKMMRLFNTVSAKQQEMDGKFTAMNRTVLLIEKYGHTLPQATQKLFSAAPSRWNNLKTKVSLAKQRLGPRIQEESARITKDLAAFGKHVEELSHTLMTSDVYSRECGMENAFQAISQFFHQLDQLDNEAQDLIELQELLETAVVNFSILPECRHELRNLQQVWETVQEVNDQQEQWKQETWQKMNTKYLRDSTNDQLTMVRSLPDDVHVWDVYLQMQESILVIQACLPLIDDLSNPAMRTRHWKQLVRVTGGILQIDNDSLKRMTLGQLLQLGLQNHVDEVRAIVYRAVKDVSIESALRTYEEIWLSKIFDLKTHVRTTAVAERVDKDDGNKSEYSESEAGTGTRSMILGRRAHSRMSSQTLGTGGGRHRRASVSSLPASLLNLGEDSGVLNLLSDVDPIFDELESHQVSLQSMQSSSAAGSFLDEVLKWQKRLQTIEAVLTVWLEVQVKWVELEEVFSGLDIKTSLNHESGLFSSANRDFRLLMRATERNPNVLQCCQRKGILPLLEKMNHHLELCRKSLLDHLEKRRQKFPRFYFLSMEDVLHIVCNGYDLNMANLYLPKLFENMGRLVFEEAPEDLEAHFQVTGVLSNLGEKLPLKQTVVCDGPIENWLAVLIPTIKSSLQQQLTSSLNHQVANSRMVEREIHSAGARRVTLLKDDKKDLSSRSGSRTGIYEKNLPGAKETSDDSVPTSKSWMLDNVAEVVHLTTQIQITDQVEKCLKAVDGGEKEAIKEAVERVEQSIQAAVVMMKGIEDEEEKKARLRRKRELLIREVAEKPQRENSASDVVTYSRLSAHHSSTQSFKASNWSLNEPMQGPIAEVPSGRSTQLEGMTEEGEEGVKPLNTMKVVLPPERRMLKVVEEEQVDKSELKLMLFPAQIQKISNLIALLANQREILNRFEKRQASGETGLTESFEWQSQMQYCWTPENATLTVKSMLNEFEYGFEYMGSTSRLVQTPVTEKAYLTLIQAIKAHMGAMGVGPNWNSRIEVVRDLAKALGQPLYLFNCSKSMDSFLLADVFKGLASTGCWVCFNNLNHILPNVLSIFTQFLTQYLDAKRAGKSSLTVFSEEVGLNSAGACFATMDSALDLTTSAAEKRLILNSSVAQLPPSLVAAFRTVSIQNPDFRIAVEVLLLSQGFVRAGELAKKLLTLREMYNKMIPAEVRNADKIKIGSDQHETSHGWSIQNLRNVINEAGSILDDMLTQKIQNMPYPELDTVNEDDETNEESAEEPKPDIREAITIPEEYIADEPEALVLALRDMFMPRLHGSDAEMFITLVEDLFPSVKIAMTFEGASQDDDCLELNTAVVNIQPDYQVNQVLSGVNSQDTQPLDNLDSAIAVGTQRLGLLPGRAFQARVAQLAQLMETHQTVAVVGPAGCGKSECIKTLTGAQRELGHFVSVQRLYSQAVEPQELLGYYNSSSEWSDGLFTTLLRKHCLVCDVDFVNSKPLIKLIHLDGQVDASQMEVFGSIFHNDGCLVLANNERIHIPHHIRIIWELGSLAHISPAVLSRIGLLSMDKSDVSWRLYLRRWIQNQPEGDQNRLHTLTERYVGTVIDYLSQSTRPTLIPGGKGKSEPKLKRMIDVSEMNMVMTFCNLLEALIAQHPQLSDLEYENYLNFAAVWAFGGTLDDKSRTMLSTWWRSTFQQYVQYPEEGEVWDYFVDGDSHNFIDWNEAIPPYSMPPHEGIPADAFVRTKSYEQLSYILGLLSDNGKPVMLAGEPGCGKTLIFQDRMKTICSGEVAEVLALNVTTNRFTTSRVLWQRLEEKLEWKHGRTYVPKGNKKLMCLVDDLNLASMNVNGCQSACEMIRQHMDSGGVYEPDLQVLREVKNVTYVTTLNPNTPASVPSISPRLLRHFGVFSMPYPRDEELHTIYTTLLNTHFCTPSSSSTSARDKQQLHLVDKEEAKLKELMSMMVSVTLEVQSRMRTMFLTTAERCHYMFNVRELSRVFKNICLSLNPGVKLETLLLLWRHECEWIYSERLVSPVDVERYNQVFVTAAKKQFTSEEFDKEDKEIPSEVREKMLKIVIDLKQPLFSNLVEQDSGIVTAGGYKVSSTTSSIAGDEEGTDQYQPRYNVDHVRLLMQDAVEEYNKGHPRIKLALYRETIERVCRLARTIQSPHEVGHALLVVEGNPGIGDLFPRLAAHLCGFVVFEVNPSPVASPTTYKLNQFKADLVTAYTKAGVKGEKVLLLLTEEELMEEDFLVYIGEFVVTGAITHLFTSEEQTSIINSIRTDVTAAGLTYTRDTAWDFFLKTVRNNVRVVLVSSTSGADFQRRCREYPALTANLNCYWFQHWSREALVEHAMYHLKEFRVVTSMQRENLAHLLASIHLAIRQLDGKETSAGQYNHLTNTTFEKFIECFVNMMFERKRHIESEHETVTTALQYINRENKLATRLKKQLEHELIVLEERKEGTIKLLSQIGQDTAITEQQVKTVMKQMDKIDKLKQALPQYSLAHERAVYKTVAVVADTKKIVENIDTNSLQELRAMQKPDVDIEDLMAAIIMILKNPSSDLTWSKGAKRQMANLERFLEELASFDDTELPESTLNLVEPYLKKASFQPQNMRRKTNSSAAASLCQWVRGVVRYHRLMISRVKPLHQKVEDTTKEVEIAEHKLMTLENKRRALEERLADLASSFEEATVDKNDQETMSETMTRQLETADKFRKALATEHEHCVQICQSLPQRIMASPGSVSLAAAFVTYLGPYDFNIRHTMLTLHWPMCLKERGVPLVIDSIDPMKGWVVDWAIDTRSRTNTVMSQFQTPVKDLQQIMEKHELESGTDEGGSEVDGAEKTPQRPDTHFDEGLNEDQADETEKKDEEKDEKTDEDKDEKQGERIVDEESVLEENQKMLASESHFAYSAETVPQISATDYRHYIHSLVKLLVGENTLQDWLTKGLSLQQIENAAIEESSWQRPPFLVDPNMNGIHWVRSKLKGQRLCTVDMQTRWRQLQVRVYSKETFAFRMENKLAFDPSIIVQIEKTILTGMPLLLMNCEENLDSMVTPLIHHANHGSQKGQLEDARLIKYSGRRLLCSNKFSLHLATPNSRAKFGPRVASTTTIINYNSTPETLQYELLSRTFARVMPHLYMERKQVLKTIQQHRDTLQVLESELLNVLENEGSGHDDKAHAKRVFLIVEAKEDIYQKLLETEEVLQYLDKICNDLSPVAKRGAMLFSVMSSLEGLRREYQFSLPFFLLMFDRAVGEEPPQEESDDKPTELMSEYSRAGSRMMTRGLSAGTRYSEKMAPEEEGTTEEAEPADILDDKADDLILPEVPTFPTPGVEYTSFSANQVKQLVDSLNQTLFQHIRQSLYEEHRLLFSTMLCLNIQYEGANHFSEEELALLLQGNPGFGGMELTLADFDCKAKQPSFLPEAKWEDMLALSVLPGPLDSLCVHVAEQPEAWEEWYKLDAPEDEPLPIKPESADTQANQRDPDNTDSPDLSPLNDFHQLLLIRLLRPDRLPIITARYISKHLTSVKPFKCTVPAILSSATLSLGVLVLMPPSPSSNNEHLPSSLKMNRNPVDLLCSYAQDKNIHIDCVIVGENTDTQISMAIDSAADKGSWVIVQDVHLASELLIMQLHQQLVRIGNTGGPLGLNRIDKDHTAGFCVWMTCEPCTGLTDNLIQALRVVAWDMIEESVTNNSEAVIEVEEPIHNSINDSLKIALVSALNSIHPNNLGKVRDLSPVLRNTVYGVCVIHGILVARQMFGSRGMSQWYALNEVVINEAVQVILQAAAEREPSLPVLHHLLTEIVFGNIVTNEWDQRYLATLNMHILKATMNQSGSIQLGTTNLPTPPANVDVADFGRWASEKLPDGGTTVMALCLDGAVKKQVNQISGAELLKNLDTLYELQHAPISSSLAQMHNELNMTRLQYSMTIVVEQLPALLELGELPLHIVNQAEHYSFPYHAPSLMSLLSMASVEMPQSVGFVLLQECHWMNSVICHIRQTLYELDQHVLGGQHAIPEELASTASALQQEHVPLSWLHPNRQPTEHTLITWLQDLLKRHGQLKSWVKEGKVPTRSRGTTYPHGHLVSVWMGGLVNPTAVITALRHEMAVLQGHLITEVDLKCHVSTSYDEDSFDIAHEGGMYLQGLYIEGASWDVDNRCLDKARTSLSLMPSVYIYPVVRGTSEHTDAEDNEYWLYDCPVFMNQSRQFCAFTLKLRCPVPLEQWVMAGTALLLDQGIPEGAIRKSSQFKVAKREVTAAAHDDHVDTPEAAKQAILDEEASDNMSDVDMKDQRESLSRRSILSRQSLRNYTAQKKLTVDIAEEPELNEDELKLNLTARSEQLDIERHQTTEFDYRMPSMLAKKQELIQHNENQNASRHPTARSSESILSSGADRNEIEKEMYKIDEMKEKYEDYGRDGKGDEDEFDNEPSQSSSPSSSESSGRTVDSRNSYNHHSQSEKMDHNKSGNDASSEDEPADDEQDGKLTSSKTSLMSKDSKVKSSINIQNADKQSIHSASSHVDGPADQKLEQEEKMSSSIPSLNSKDSKIKLNDNIEAIASDKESSSKISLKQEDEKSLGNGFEETTNVRTDSRTSISEREPVVEKDNLNSEYEDEIKKGIRPHSTKSQVSSPEVKENESVVSDGNKGTGDSDNKQFLSGDSVRSEGDIEKTSQKEKSGSAEDQVKTSKVSLEEDRDTKKDVNGSKIVKKKSVANEEDKKEDQSSNAGRSSQQSRTSLKSAQQTYSDPVQIERSQREGNLRKSSQSVKSDKSQKTVTSYKSAQSVYSQKSTKSNSKSQGKSGSQFSVRSAKAATFHKSASQGSVQSAKSTRSQFTSESRASNKSGRMVEGSQPSVKSARKSESGKSRGSAVSMKSQGESEKANGTDSKLKRVEHHSGDINQSVNVGQSNQVQDIDFSGDEDYPNITSKVEPQY
ncbi:dynein heavy chain 9, axonemal-like [Anneissia japonica]|uniref:dynein heavy chain 9, axonemal-like n=1 Tax=Anneissia japonica TaxID=1529436 RepID=UPI001425B773|nr:dynein heavy chain 9, axonemal-like [Anneissia japonica]